MTKIHICDYRVGNIHNVERAFRHIGADVIRCESGEELGDADGIVIPGVGAFNDCITRFRDAGFEAPIRRHVEAGVPLLGICVGMQMLADVSMEFGEHKGLGLIPGIVKKIPGKDLNDLPVKLPHINWAKLQAGNRPWLGSPLENATENSFTYFVHSYYFDCKNKHNILANVEYGGCQFPAAVCSGNIYGTQFHPEKSAEVGLGVLKDFVKIIAKRIK